MALTKAKFGVISSALASGNATDGYVLTADGSGNSAWEEVAGGPTHKTFGTSSIMIGDNATGTIDAANNNTGVGVDIFAALTSGDDNTVLGKGAGAALTTGQRNVFVGIESGATMTTGSENCYVGRLAGKLATSGYSTGVGTEALYNNTGNHNTAVGIQALMANTSGTRNVAVGSNALDAMTTGYNSTAVGHAALTANTTANSNTAIGAFSMENNTTGAANTAVGEGALLNNTTGSSNVAIGYTALFDYTGSNTVAVGYASLANATGGNNTGLGHQTGENITSGTYNTCVGSNAGNTMTSPTYNTLVGYNAGQGSYPLTTGSSCTMVGALARPSGTLGNANGENVFGFNMSASGTNTTTLGSGGSGLYASHGSNSWTSISDERYKKDIVDSEVGLSFINDLRPRNFKWKTCGEVPSDTPRYEENSDELINPNLTGVMHGFIAQEVKAVIDNHSEVPNNQLIWKQDPDGIQGLAEGELVPVLVKAVQELSAKNDALEARIETLEGE